MTRALPLLRQINESLAGFEDIPPKLRTKLTGSLAVEVLREHLRESGLPVSQRDVFIRGVKHELDLVVPSPDSRPSHNLIFEPSDVRAVLEVKYSGVYNRQVVPGLKACFDSIKSRCPHVFCACVVVQEREGFRFAANSAELEHPVYTLHLWSGSRENARDTGEWQNLIKALRELSSERAV